MSTLWNSRYAQRTLGVKSSAIRDLLKVTQKPGIISFGGGLPAPDVFPVKRFEEACHKVLSEHGAEALQYGTTEGYQPLREMIARNIARYGIVASAENVLLTSGSQQALDLIGKLLINRGDRILLEAPTYLGALQAFNVYGAQYVPVPVDNDGLLTEQLDSSLRAGPKFMYVLPNFQNPQASPSPKDAATSSFFWLTSTAFLSSKTILTVSFATKASTSLLWSYSIAKTCAAITDSPSATSST